jgi:divalent metal cation (Fe/Co/Zn/Cd) transporter
VTRGIAAVTLAVTALSAAPANADHPVGGRMISGLSPLMSALLTGALAFLVALVVIVVVMVMTKPRGGRETEDTE